MSPLPSDEVLGLGLEEIVREMPAAVVVVEAPSGRILNSNASARKMFERQLGRPIPDVLTDDWEIFHPDGHPYGMEEWPLVRSTTSGEKVVDEEYFNILPDGSRMFVRCNSSPIYDGNGALVAGVLLMVDITPEKLVANQLSYFGSLLESTDDAIVGTDADFRLTVWNAGAERLYGYSADEALGRHAREVATYEGDQSRRQLENSLMETSRTRTELTAYRKDGTQVEVEMVAVAVSDDRGEVVGYLGVHRDVSERKRAGEERDSRARREALVAQLGIRALAGEDLRSVMDDAVSLIARALDVELVGIAESLPSGEGLILRAGVGWREGALGRETTVAGRTSLLSYTVTAGGPVVSEDLTADERFRVSSLLSDHHAMSAATVVIEGREERFGALGAFSKQRRSFSEDDLNFLQAVAHVISTAVERVASDERLEEVRETERRRIARDLHDEALQNLTDALAEASGSASGVEAGERLARLEPSLKRAGERLRGAIYDLRLGGEEDRPFPDLLQGLVEVHRERAVGGEIRLELGDGVPDGPLGRTGTEVLRIVGEALVNARRHSGARDIRVHAWAPRGRLCVAVSDDGRGFDVANPPSGAATGITGMRERAALLGGDVDIRSAPGEGTQVRLELAFGGDPDRSGRSVRVLLVEDHATVREAIAAMFERQGGFDVVGQAGSLAEARGMLEEVDIAVVDLGLPDGYGGDLIKELREVNPRAQALVLSASLDHADIARAVESGAAGTLDKTAHLGEVVDAVRRLRAGEALLPIDEIVELLRFAGRQRERERGDRQAIERLTPREREVLQALAEGLDSQSIADRLHITIRTERNHIASILAKLGVHSQPQALVFALRYDVIQVL